MVDPLILVLGTADWNQPIATNQHYVVRELSKRYRVIFTESMGLRRPEFSRRDLARILNRLRGARSSTSREVPIGTTVLSPKTIPLHRGAARVVNHRLIRRTVDEWRKWEGTRILWTYTPVTYGLEVDADIVMYHCVDLLGEVPGIDKTLIETSERTLATSADLAIASSRPVADHLRATGFTRIDEWPNVADVSAIDNANDPRHPIKRQERAVFAGNLSDSKVDFDLLEEILRAGIALDLAGPISQGGGNSRGRVDQLVRMGATYHGLLSLADLARLYWSCSVGLIPYRINAYTRGVSPMKTFEYLAAGLMVVATPIPSVQPEVGKIAVVADVPTALAAIRAGLRIDPRALASRRALASSHSWSTRGETALQLIRELLQARAGS